jgi:methylated-DNA-[protein]-cysteine S-methyltransferase
MGCLFYYESPIGKLGIGEVDGYITHILFGEEDLENYIIKETELIKKTHIQLNEYFAGKRIDFDLPLKYINGTPFQKEVWDALKKINYGSTCSYKDIATIIGRPKAVRAVGGANNKNNIPIIIPCHRVIGANGALIGYGGGIDKKVYLLELEQKFSK